MPAQKKPKPDRPSRAGHSPSEAKSPHPSGEAALSLSAAESELLGEVREAAEPDRFDIIARADRETVDSLIRKRLIRVRTIPKTALRGGTITRRQAKDAVLAVMREREKSGGDPPE